MLSISGAQIKESLRLQKNKLRLTEPGERGHYILKPIPRGEDFDALADMPANEHLTMQIAAQVYKLNTAANGLVFFQNGEPAYLTKRFDVQADDSGILQEDFASLAGTSASTPGADYRYRGSYEHIAQLMKKYMPAYIVEVEKLFARVLFNYLFCNGDAHMKNFSVQALPTGDYVLSPAYDLMNTRLHLPYDTAMALEDGLYPDAMESESYLALGFFSYDDFITFGKRIGMMPKRMKRTLDFYRTKHDAVYTLTANSYLSANSKKQYIALYEDRLNALNISFSKSI